MCYVLHSEWQLDDVLAPVHHFAKKNLCFFIGTQNCEKHKLVSEVWMD